MVNAFDAPARQSFVLEMVERPVLTNAIALNGTMFNTATAIGPAIGGVTYAAFGPGWCFAINGASFLAVIAALVAMRLAPTQVRTFTSSALADIREGLHAVRSNRRILAVICLVGAASLFTSASSTLMPAWAVQVLGGNALTNGALTSARGIGALLAALSIATLSHKLRKGRVMTVASMAFPIALVLFSFTRSLPLSLLALLYVGASNIFVANLANSLVQTMVPDKVRGRVMGIYMLSFFGFTTIGAILAGSVAKSFGVPLTVALGGVCFFLCALVVSFLVP